MCVPSSSWKIEEEARSAHRGHTEYQNPDIPEVLWRPLGGVSNAFAVSDKLNKCYVYKDCIYYEEDIYHVKI